MNVEAAQVRSGRVGKMRVQIHPSREAMGLAAASATAEEIRRLGETRDIISIIFATGASQLATLDALTRMSDLPWQKVVGFHMDEYVGLPIDHPASFRGYLRKNLTDKVAMKKFFEIDGTATNLEEVCATYAKEMRSTPPQICMVGIGENGHLAFNDPGVADFQDPLDVKVVPLDDTCRTQQAAEGWFASSDEVPEQAISITIPTILRVPVLIVSVPGKRKAAIVRRTLEESISTACPATILREHPGTVLYLDEDAATELHDQLIFD
jgi:glucosamine-6-phosphate deaminase